MPEINKVSPATTPPAPSLPAELKQPKKDVEEGTKKAAHATQKVKEDTASNAEKIKQKGKETGGAIADGVETTVDSISENAGEAKEGVKQAAGGLWSGIKKPFISFGGKVSNVAANARTQRPNEAVGPLLGAALLIGGTALYIASQMGSWGVTLCVSLPALAAGAAVVGLLSLAITYGRRIFKGTPKPSDDGVNPNSRSHRVGVEANRAFASEEEIVKQLREKLINQKEKLSKDVAKNAGKLADLNTQIEEYETELKIIGNYKVAPAAAKIVAAAEVKAEVVTSIKAPVVEKVTTTEETVAGDQAADVPGVTNENKAETPAASDKNTKAA